MKIKKTLENKKIKILKNLNLPKNILEYKTVKL